MASASSWMLPATISWLAALTVCPEPAGPTCTIVLPTASSTGLAASKSSAAPPTMIDRLASTHRPRPADRRVQHPQAALAAGLAHPYRDVRPDRAHVDVQRARPSALAKTPSSPHGHRLDVRRVRHHGDHHVGDADRAGHVVGAPAAGLDQPLHPLR